VQFSCFRNAGSGVSKIRANELLKTEITAHDQDVAEYPVHGEQCRHSTPPHLSAEAQCAKAEGVEPRSPRPAGGAYPPLAALAALDRSAIRSG
jgi:hypothetical protein